MRKYQIKKPNRDFKFLDITCNIKGTRTKKWWLITKERMLYLNMRDLAT